MQSSSEAGFDLFLSGMDASLERSGVSLTVPHDASPVRPSYQQGQSPQHRQRGQSPQHSRHSSSIDAQRMQGLVQSLESVALEKDENGRLVFPDWIAPRVQQLSSTIKSMIDAEGDDDSDAFDDDDDDDDESETSSVASGVRWKVDFRDNLPFVREGLPGHHHRRGRRKRRGPDPQLSSSLRRGKRTPKKSPTQQRKKKGKTKTKKRKGKGKGRLMRLEAWVDMLSATLADKLHHQQLREQEWANDMERVRDIERGKYLQLLNKLQQLTQLQGDQRLQLERLKEQQAANLSAAEEAARRAREDLARLRESHMNETDTLYLKAQDRVRAAQDELSRLAREKAEMDAASEAMKDALERTTKELGAAQLDKRRLQEELDALRSRGTDHEKDNYRLREKLNSVMAQLEELRAMHVKYRAKYSAQKEENAVLRRQLKRAQDDAEAMRERLVELEIELDDAGPSYGGRRVPMRDHAGKGAAPGDMDDERKQYLRRRFQSAVQSYMVSYYRERYRGQLQECMSLTNQVNALEEGMKKLRLRQKAEVAVLEGTLDDTRRQLNQAKLDHAEEMARLERDIKTRLLAAEESTAQAQEGERRAKEKVAGLQKRLFAAQRRVAQLEEETEQRRLEEKELAEPALRHTSKVIKHSFKGDYLLLRDSKLALSVIYQLGDEDIIFSDYCELYTSGGVRSHKTKQLLVITNNHVVLMMSGTKFKVRRRIAIASIRNMTLSKKNTSVLVLHHVSEHDQLVVTPKRTEVVYHLNKMFHRINNKAHKENNAVPDMIDYNFGERVWITERDLKMRRDVVVPATQELEVSSTKVFAQSRAPLP